MARQSQPSQLSDELKESKKFEISIAIDFGTDGLGVAYALPNANEIYVHDKWNSKHYGTIVKPKTIILFDDKFETVAVGLDAKHVYMNLSSNKKQTWMLFERFKMSLYEEKIKANDMDEKKKECKNINAKSQKIAIESEITASNGKKCSSEKVFIATFKHINETCKKYLKKRKIKTINDNTQWIITVPAIWNDESKNKMKNWAEKAGLINKDINNHCKIVYEPDCASLALLYFMKDASNIHYDKDKKKKKRRRKSTSELSCARSYSNSTNDDNYTLVAGDKYILIDAGGGTVDIACHEIIAEFGVKEIYHPSGGKWGSTYIDDEYIKILETIFSKKWMDEFRKESPNKYVAMLYHFQNSKQSFYTRNKNSKTHNVKLPFEFLSFIEEKLANKCNENVVIAFSNPTDEKEEEDNEQDELIEQFMENIEIDGKKNLIQVEEDCLSISVVLWKKMFDFVINPIINHVQNLLDNVPLLMSKHLKYICLVGGLSCSKYFQHRIKQQFGIKSKYKLEIIIPHKPILSVVQGAAFFGITANFVRARRLKYTYGVVVAKLKRIAMRDEVPDEHIEEHEIYNEYDNKVYINGCIKIIATKNEEVQLYGDEVKQMITARMDPQHNVVKKKIFCSEMFEPKTINDGKVIGSMDVKFGDKDPENMEMVSEFHFSETMLKIFVYPKKTPNKKYELEVNYNIDE